MKTDARGRVLATLLAGAAVLASSSISRALPPVERFVVYSSGASAGDCPQNDPCTLAYALIWAETTDTLYMGGGDYNGGAVVNLTNRTLTIRGGWDGSPTGPIVINTTAHETKIHGSISVRAFQSYLVNSTLALQDLTLRDGTMPGSGSGAYFSTASYGTVNMTRVMVAHNGDPANTTSGGGIFALDISLNFTDCTFIWNRAQYGGGAIELDGASAQITRTKFDNNHSAYGAAIEVQNPSSVNVDQSVFTRNGGASIVLVSTSDPVLTMRNNFLLHNGGAAIRVMAGEAYLYHNTIQGDGAYDGVDVDQTAVGEMRNNILYNLAYSITKDALNTTFSIFYTLFYDNMHDDNPGTHPVVGNPCFMDGGADEPGYHLASCSVAINAGEMVVEVDRDYDGNTRPQWGKFDIGADEYTAGRLFLPLSLKLP